MILVVPPTPVTAMVTVPMPTTAIRPGLLLPMPDRQAIAKIYGP